MQAMVLLRPLVATPKIIIMPFASEVKTKTILFPPQCHNYNNLYVEQGSRPTISESIQYIL